MATADVNNFADRREDSFAKGRNLVLCFDGTANEYGQYNTNIVKLFTFLEKEAPEQLVYYQTGVGTGSQNTPGLTNPVSQSILKAVDLGIACFLDQHVQAGYRFLQSVWQPLDRIYLFGFSRGAYTARALAGMLYTVGLLPRGMPEQVPFAYKIFKKGLESTGYKRSFSRAVTIEFIGVFDTVSSVGALYPRVLPFTSSNVIAKTFRHAMALDEHRAKFRSNPWHLTVDPEDGSEQNEAPSTGILRTTLKHAKAHVSGHASAFHQNPDRSLDSPIASPPMSPRSPSADFTAKGNSPNATLKPGDLPRTTTMKSTDSSASKLKKAKTLDTRIALDADRIRLDHEEGLDQRAPTNVKEVWFAGCHCDVGGGNAKDSDPNALANIPLRWMIKELIASDAGLIFRRSALERANIDMEEIIAAAERTKIEDAIHAQKMREVIEEKKAEEAKAGGDSKGGARKEETTAQKQAEQVPEDNGSPTASLLKHLFTRTSGKPAKPLVTSATMRVTDSDGAKAVAVKADNTDPTSSEFSGLNEKSQSVSDTLVSSDEKQRTGGASAEQERAILFQRFSNSKSAADAKCVITDELVRAPGWWILETLPFVDSNQDEHGRWVNTVRVNFFRSRNIPRPPHHSNPNSRHNTSMRGVSISDAPALFHISVKYRMEQEDCKVSSWRSFWRKKNLYKPRAWPSHGHPIFVE